MIMITKGREVIRDGTDLKPRTGIGPIPGKKMVDRISDKRVQIRSDPVTNGELKIYCVLYIVNI